MGWITKIEKKLDELSRCPGCGHSTEVETCDCTDSNCGCGTD